MNKDDICIKTNKVDMYVWNGWVLMNILEALVCLEWSTKLWTDAGFVWVRILVAVIAFIQILFYNS